ncbi:MAG: tRNA lysidine(34) synthetase TilS, partial [Thermodesulfobacteriota bacterium]|nr:tRNA lysidine(34) synthetase TilS [Thermodesulfobacteriota bacterium]
MHPLEKETEKIIRSNKLFLSDETIVVAVSGGPDSIALLHVLSRLSRELALKLVAVYVDHGLRPAETIHEAELVQAQAQLLQIPCRVGRVDVHALVRQKNLSEEHGARILRYDFLEETAEEFGAGKIALAHTADDQAEEVLLRLIRGTGRTGLAGMKMIRNNKFVRPFLGISKSRLLQYLSDRKIPFLSDSSNLERVYLRNRVRLDLLPQLEKYNPNIRQTLRQTARILGDEEVLLAGLADAAWTDVLQGLPGEKAGQPSGLRLNINQFLSQHRAIQRRVVEMIFIEMDGVPSFNKIDQVLYLAKSGQGGGMLHFSRGLRVVKKRKELIFSYPQGRVAKR